MTRKTKIIAHRGYWKSRGACDNSIKAAESAILIGADGIEMDVWITKDDSIIVNHDASYNGLDILTSSYSELAHYPLPNGETIPTIRDFLRLMKNSPNMELFIEIKANRVVDRLVEIIKEESIHNPIKYISFSKIACDHLIAIDSSFHVQPLQPFSDGALISGLSISGYKGVAFTSGFYHENPITIDAFHGLNMTLSTWIINTPQEYIWFMNKGFKYVISDDPLTLIKYSQDSFDYWERNDSLKNMINND